MKGNIDCWDLSNIFQKLCISKNSLHTIVWLSLMKKKKKVCFWFWIVFNFFPSCNTYFGVPAVYTAHNVVFRWMRSLSKGGHFLVRNESTSTSIKEMQTVENIKALTMNYNMLYTYFLINVNNYELVESLCRFLYKVLENSVSISRCHSK